MPDKLQTSPEIGSGRRFTLVDALRGIAAVAVLFHHLLFSSELQATLWLALPGWILAFCQRGAFGVDIFFVLSGFVITHSLRNVQLNWKGVGSFMLRRQLRLDPPYWAMLALTLASLYVESHVLWIEKKPLPTWYDIFTNLFYLQNIVASYPLMSVSWTLCLEVQFYLVFILLLVAGRSLSRNGASSVTLSAALVTALAIASLAVPRHYFDGWFIHWWHTFPAGLSAEQTVPDPCWFFQWWYYFAAGALCYWAVSVPRLRGVFSGFLGLYLVVAALQNREPTVLSSINAMLPMLVGWITALLLYVAGRMGKLSTWLDFAPFQYLGRISYSLYLSHLLVAVYVMRLGYRLTNTSHAGALLWFCLAGAASLVTAHVMYVLIERPSIRFAAQFKPRRVGAAPSPGSHLPGGVKEQLQNV